MNDEFKDLGLGAIPSPPDERDFPIAQAYALMGIEKPVEIPASYILSGNLPPVLDQGATPQCVAYSSAGLKLYEDRIDQASFFPFDEPTFFTRIGGGSNGAIIRNAFSQMLNVGYPVKTVDDAKSHRVAAYFAVPVNQADIQAALMSFGPLVLGMTWYNSWFNPVAGVLPAPSGGIAGGHAVMAIGWDSRGLRIRNSWGTSWGLQGDFFLPWAYLSNTWEAWKAIDVIENLPYTPRSAVNYTAIEPTRVLDTRVNVGLSGAFKTSVARTLQVAGVAGIPANAVAIAGNLTVTQASAPGYLAARPTPQNAPSTSSLNFPIHDDRANSITGAGLATDGTLAITFVSIAGATTHVILDITGYFSTEPRLRPNRTLISSWVVKLYNLWVAAPLWLTKGLRDAAIAAVGAVLALNLVFPGSIEQLKSEGLIALVAASAAVLAVVRVEILPPLLDWIIQHLNLYFVADMDGETRLAK